MKSGTSIPTFPSLPSIPRLVQGGGGGGYEADMILSFASGADGSLLTTAALTNATEGHAGSWEYAYSATSLKHTKLQTNTGERLTAILVDGTPYDGSETGLGIEFDMQAAIDAAVSIASITIGSPTTINTTGAHGRVTGDRVTLRGIAGSTNLNNTWTVTVTDTDTFTIPEESLSASSGGIVFDAYEGGLWAPVGVDGDASLTALVTFKPNHTLTNTTALDLFRLDTGGFVVMQWNVSFGAPDGAPGTLNAHGQDGGAQSTVGPGFAIATNTLYSITLRASETEQEAQLIVLNAATGALVGASFCESVVSGVASFYLQDYLTWEGGTVEVKNVAFGFDANARFPMDDFTCPPVTNVGLEQTGTSTLELTWKSQATNFIIERSNNAGANWSTLETAYGVPDDNPTEDGGWNWSYVDTTVIDTVTYLYRLTAKIKQHSSATANSGSVTVDDSVTFLIDEDFETASGWFLGGSANDNYTAVPLAGASSLRCANATSDFAEEGLPGNEPDVYCKFLFKTESALATGTIFKVLDASFNVLSEVLLLADGTLTTDFVHFTVSTLSANTLYTIWCRFKKGTGANAIREVWFTAGNSSTRPARGSANHATDTAAPFTADISRFQCYGIGSNTANVFDNVQIAASDFE